MTLPPSPEHDPCRREQVTGIAWLLSGRLSLTSAAGAQGIDGQHAALAVLPDDDRGNPDTPPMADNVASLRITGSLRGYCPWGTHPRRQAHDHGIACTPPQRRKACGHRLRHLRRVDWRCSALKELCTYGNVYEKSPATMYRRKLFVRL